MLAAEIDVLFGTEMNEILRILREEALTALFAAAAWKDFKFRRIPNRLLAAGVLASQAVVCFVHYVQCHTFSPLQRTDFAR